MLPLHPLVVHFPLGLLVTAAVMELLALALKRPELSRTGWWLQLTGTLALGIAVLTGIIAGDLPGLSLAAGETMETHEELAFVVSAVFAALLLWRAAARTAIPGRTPWIFVGLLSGAVLLLLVVAWFGGELVYRHGVGVMR